MKYDKIEKGSKFRIVTEEVWQVAETHIYASSVYIEGRPVRIVKCFHIRGEFVPVEMVELSD